MSMKDNLLSWRWWLGLRKKMGPAPVRTLTVVVPAHNEGETIIRTVQSILAQTYPVTEIIVVDDYSEDNTGDLARSTGVTVVRTPVNQKTKARAQNFVLPMVKTEMLVTIDGDTILEPNAIEEIMRCFNDPNTALACGFVIPAKLDTFWEVGRLVQYLFALFVTKRAQDRLGIVQVSSGCFSAFTTDVLREVGGFQHRTMAEDMDNTWDTAKKGYGVRFTPTAICRVFDPPNFRTYVNQVYRWQCSFLQNIQVRGIRNLCSAVGPRLGSLLYVDFALNILGFFLLPIEFLLLWKAVSVFQNLGIADFWGMQSWIVALWFIVLSQALVVWIPVLLGARTIGRATGQRGLVKATLKGLIPFYVLQYVDQLIFFWAVRQELLPGGTPLKIWKKGH